MPPTLVRVLAAAVLGTAAALPLTLGVAAPAGSATCADGGGVSVVVDFKGLGGGVQSVCDADGGGQKASSLFSGNGFALTYAQRTPGFVCRVQGKPASDPCVNTSPANAYWGLWWSDGTTGKWTYASVGAGSLSVPAGGSVAFAWDGVDGQAAPGVAPPKQAAAPTPSPTPSHTPSSTPSPTPSPTPKPTEKPTPTPTDRPTPAVEPTPGGTLPTGSAPTPSASSTGTPSGTPSPSGSLSVGATSAAAGTDGTPDSATTSDPEAGQPGDGGGIATWVPLAVIAVLFGAAAVVVVRRRSAG